MAGPQDAVHKPPERMEAFFSSLASGRAAHAYLIIGPEGSGKRAFAGAAARALLCDSRSDSGKACGACSACAKTNAGSHPDLFTLRPAKASISVDEVRAAIDNLAIAANEGGGRVVVVEEADKLTPQAQNALLKTLEEPGRDVTWFLLASDGSAMLPTIRSRCRVVRMLPDGNVARLLRSIGASEEQALEIAVLSAGAAERAKELYASKACADARGKAYDILSLRTAASVPAMWQSIKEDKALSREILLWLECIAADGLKMSCGGDAKMPNSHTFSRFTFQQWKGIIDEIVTIRKKLGSNVAWNVAVEPLLWRIAEGETE